MLRVRVSKLQFPAGLRPQKDYDYPLYSIRGRVGEEEDDATAAAPPAAPAAGSAKKDDDKRKS